MKRFFSGFALAAALTFFAGAGYLQYRATYSPRDDAPADPTKVEAAIMARVDDCNIWQVKIDAFRTIYFARCPEGTRSTSWDAYRTSGKRMATLGENR
jgi:hypothetical protein